MGQMLVNFYIDIRHQPYIATSDIVLQSISHKCTKKKTTILNYIFFRLYGTWQHRLHVNVFY